MRVKHIETINGRMAWSELEKIAAYAHASGVPLTHAVAAIG